MLTLLAVTNRYRRCFNTNIWRHLRCWAQQTIIIIFDLIRVFRTRLLYNNYRRKRERETGRILTHHSYSAAPPVPRHSSVSSQLSFLKFNLTIITKEFPVSPARYTVWISAVSPHLRTPALICHGNSDFFLLFLSCVPLPYNYYYLETKQPIWPHIDCYSSSNFKSQLPSLCMYNRRFFTWVRQRSRTKKRHHPGYHCLSKSELQVKVVLPVLRTKYVE